MGRFLYPERLCHIGQMRDFGRKRARVLGFYFSLILLYILVICAYVVSFTSVSCFPSHTDTPTCICDMISREAGVSPTGYDNLPCGVASLPSPITGCRRRDCQVTDCAISGETVCPPLLSFFF
uniref:Uncharacterized protein n=1 Tax=Trypanosoma congolense (strain IL3000) TaxID=1068625 RepID=G0V014_TRYCI|nr:hypothetical protein, unlikely [Trypanosoma congolense IL3000]